MKSLVSFLLLITLASSAPQLRDVGIYPDQPYYLRSALYGGGSITTSCNPPFVGETSWNSTLKDFPIIFKDPIVGELGATYYNSVIQFATSGCPQYGLNWKISETGNIGVSRDEHSIFNIAPHQTVEGAYLISHCRFPTRIRCSYAVLGEEKPNGLTSLVVSFVDHPKQPHPFYFVDASAAAMSA